MARRAGVTPAAPYHHFNDKSALLAAVAEEGFAALCEKLEAALAPLPAIDLRRRFAAIARAYLEFARENPAHYRVMFLPEIKSSRDYPSFHAIADRTLQVVANEVRLASPKANAEEVMVRTVLIWAIGHGLASLWNDGVLDSKLTLGNERAFFGAAVEQMATFASGIRAHRKRPEPKPRRR